MSCLKRCPLSRGGKISSVASMPEPPNASDAASHSFYDPNNLMRLNAVPEVEFPKYNISDVFKVSEETSHNSVRDCMHCWPREKRIKSKITKARLQSHLLL